MICIDGSFGEGGGQVLRSSLSLSVITGKAFKIMNIRAGRNKNGLLRQHLTAVRACAEICGASVSGDALRSLELSFSPGKIKGGEYFFDIGSAGSTSLVLQTILPPLLLSPSPARITLKGGTHNQMAPPFEFIDKCFLRLLRKMGVDVEAKISCYGFYPAGGGQFTLSINPGPLKPIELLSSLGSVKRRVYAFSAHIPDRIIKKEARYVAGALSLDPSECVYHEVKSPGPGNIVLLEIESSALTEVITGFGAKGVPLEKVCDSLVKEAQRYIELGAPVGEHLADQLLIPMAMAGGGAFLTGPLSKHTRTNIEVIKKFLDVPIHVKEAARELREVIIG